MDRFKNEIRDISKRIHSGDYTAIKDMETMIEREKENLFYPKKKRRLGND